MASKRRNIFYQKKQETTKIGSGDRGDSEGESDLEGRASEDEFAEDELSVGGPERGGGGGGVSCRNKGAEFHEGLLLDALLRPPPHRLPYILPVPPPPGHYEPVHRYGPPPRPEFTTFRPAGHDSDSGYSQDTSGGRRRTPHRLPHATDLVIS
ncbi:hypothetical protein AAG570_007922 [Ranatra chinensis]|uniref:Uncharacterized protein n=1 Tax=Ranatra chinensis TaxID=642074 RepID=A0ABD0XT84_9HEMI